MAIPKDYGEHEQVVLPFGRAVWRWCVEYVLKWREAAPDPKDVALVQEVIDLLERSLEGVCYTPREFARVVIRNVGDNFGWRQAEVIIAVNREPPSNIGITREDAGIREIGSKGVIRKGSLSLSFDPTEEHPDHWRLDIEVA